MNTERKIYTIGHSTQSIDQFLSLLQIFKIEAIADVRRFPTSKKYPQFERKNFHAELSKNDIEYVWLGELLGGFRKDGYQLYMQGEAFSQGIKQLIALAEQQIIAVMCAEKLFFRCHRRFIADRLLYLNWQVIHVFDKNITYPHKPSDTMPLNF